MSADVAVLVISSATGLLAVVLLVDRSPAPTIGRRRDGGASARATAALATGVLIVVFSGWVVPAIVAAAFAWIATGAWQRRDRTVGDAERTDALASWIENLRDVLVAGDQPIGAITATVATCPGPIRPAVRRLAAGLGRQHPDIVLRRFADDIDDPLGDLVAAGLLIAIRRGARTVAVLTSLADQARHQADRRRIVDAERAPVQREVGLLTAIMGSLIVGLIVFGRADYLQPYETIGGQLFLAAVLAIYGVLLLRVQRLARFPRPQRFLGIGTRANEPLSGQTA